MLNTEYKQQYNHPTVQCMHIIYTCTYIKITQIRRKMERLTGDVWCSAHHGGAGKWLAADSFSDSQKKKPNNIKRCVACIAATKAAKTSAGATPPSAAQPPQPRLSGAPRPTPQVRPFEPHTLIVIAPALCFC